MTADTYETGLPCRNGHIAPRYKANKRCIACIKAKSDAAYVKHGERIRASSAKWYAENTERANARNRAYHERMSGTEQYDAMRAAYHEEHRERMNALRKEKNSTPEAKAAKAAEKRAQRARYTAYEHKRRAAALKAVPAWYGSLDEFVFVEATHLCALRRRATGTDWHVDHVIPLLARTACGLHSAANVQVIPERLNRRKNNKLWLTEPLEWLAHI
jgi:hypothetical protein